MCTSGACSCPAGLTRDGNDCIDLTRDPVNCGSLSNACAEREYCVMGSCTCRPGWIRVAGACTDPSSDPENCGAMGNRCAAPTPACQGGSCVAACSGGTRTCGANRCVDTNADPSNCGDCAELCDPDAVCVAGRCEQFVPAVTCSSCPCAVACGMADACCAYPGSIDPVCVEGGLCP